MYERSGLQTISNDLSLIFANFDENTIIGVLGLCAESRVPNDIFSIMLKYYPQGLIKSTTFCHSADFIGWILQFLVTQYSFLIYPFNSTATPILLQTKATFNLHQK